MEHYEKIVENQVAFAALKSYFQSQTTESSRIVTGRDDKQI